MGRKSNNDDGCKRAKEAKKHFYLPGGKADDFRCVDELFAFLPDPLIPIAQAFRANLDAVVSTVTMPVIFALSSAQDHRFQQLLMSSRLRVKADLIDTPDETGPDGEWLTDEGERNAVELARKTLEEESEAPEGRRAIANEASHFLLNVVRFGGLGQAAEELLRQGLVLTWSAFEVLSRDVFVTILNARPDLSLILLADSVTRKLFPIRDFSVELLSSFDFNVSDKMGEVLRSLNPLTSLPAIRSTFDAVLPKSTALHKALRSEAMWLISKRRHLIVHQRARVDEEYLSTTSDSLCLGDILQVSTTDFENHLTQVRDVGCLLLNAAKDAIGAEDSP